MCPGRVRRYHSCRCAVTPCMGVQGAEALLAAFSLLSRTVAEKLDVVTRTYELLLWLLPQVARLPRWHRFTLGDRLETLALDILEQPIQAQYQSKKLPPLRDININLRRLRFMIRLTKDLEMLGMRRYEHAGPGIDETGRLGDVLVVRQQLSAQARFQRRRTDADGKSTAAR